jgi:hypothetical protein
MFKNLFLLIFSVTVGVLIIIVGFLWASPRNTQVLKIILPKSLFSLEKAPTDSLSGEVASISGKIAWQSRIAPVAILVSGPIKLQQGEEVDSYNDGGAVVSFSSVGVITISANTQVSFIQTLPQSFVVEQKQGIANYIKTGESPLSIVGLDLLVDIDSGESIVLVDKDNSEVIVSVKTGAATAAFNDSDNNTNVVSIKSGQKYVFEDDTRIGKIKKL